MYEIWIHLFNSCTYCTTIAIKSQQLELSHCCENDNSHKSWLIWLFWCMFNVQPLDALPSICNSWTDIKWLYPDSILNLRWLALTSLKLNSCVCNSPSEPSRLASLTGSKSVGLFYNNIFGDQPIVYNLWLFIVL